MPVVTLTTDFGLRDPYVAEMKGVMLGLAPELRFVDITHDIASHDVVGGALALEAAVAYFPAGTVHLAVVDPGVGTARRGLVVTTADAAFVAPDNGLLTPLLARGGWRAFELSAPEFRRPYVSRTFHGRDVFAPAAAHLARGVAPERFGAAVADPVRVPWPEVHAVGGAVAGAVLHVDRFGNLVTSIAADAVEALGAAVTILIAGRRLPLVGTYADLPLGAAGGLIGSSNRLEVAVREGSAAAVLKARRGTPVAVSPTTPRKSTTTKTRRR
ncbi:MAG: SAM-dependent chlorinase/fluorinase [Candidatus Rokubacteria bacterium]|nr:SAM-dependent chlorinase/fluorinase [Candidatus Rokubacteria bacterium]